VIIDQHEGRYQLITTSKQDEGAGGGAPFGEIASPVTKALRWLWAIENEDGGWGPYQGHPSRLVSTCEALLAMKRGGRGDPALELPIKYLLDSLQGSTASMPQHERHYAFAASALCTVGDREDSRIDVALDLCMTELVTFQVGGGFGHFHAGKDAEPATFATLLAIRAFAAAKDWNTLLLPDRVSYVNDAMLWLVSTQRPDGGWGYTEREANSPAATAFAVLALIEGARLAGQMPMSRSLSSAQSYLESRVGDSMDVSVEQKLGGNAVYEFNYITAAWVVIALLHLGERPWAHWLWPLVRYVGSLQTVEGGWRDRPDRGPNLWATYGGVETVAAIVKAVSGEDKSLAVVAAAAATDLYAVKSVAEIGTSVDAGATPPRSVDFSLPGLKISLSPLAFATVLGALALGYGAFWVSRTSLERPTHLFLILTVAILAFVLPYRFLRDGLQTGKEVTLAIATVASGLAVALELSRQGLP
jgi:prenyltransferase beta subunit